MLIATLTIPALGTRTRAAFLCGLSSEPCLSLSQPGDGSAVFTLVDTTAEAAQALQRLLAGQYGAVKLDFAEASAAVEEDVEALTAPDAETIDCAVEAEAIPEAAPAVGLAPVEEIVVETPEVVTTDENVTDPVVVRLSMAASRVLVEQGQVLLRSLPAGSFLVNKPATSWDGTVWCIKFASVDETALTLALEGLTCTALIRKGGDLADSTLLPEITVDVTDDAEAAMALIAVPAEIISEAGIASPVFLAEEEIVLQPARLTPPRGTERRTRR